MSEKYIKTTFEQFINDWYRYTLSCCKRKIYSLRFHPEFEAILSDSTYDLLEFAYRIYDGEKYDNPKGIICRYHKHYINKYLRKAAPKGKKETNKIHTNPNILYSYTSSIDSDVYEIVDKKQQNIAEDSLEIVLMKEKIEKLPQKYKEVINDMYYKNLSINKMTKKYKKSKDTIIRIQKAALKYLSGDIALGNLK